METMAAAHSQIERQLTSLQAMQRRVRQEEITAEISNSPPESGPAGPEPGAITIVPAPGL